MNYPPSSNDDFERQQARLRQFLAYQKPILLKDPNINSVGLGFKVINGKQTDIICIHCSVNRKVKPESLPQLGSSLIPAVFDIEGQMMPTDITERRYQFNHLTQTEIALRQSLQNTLQPGMSIGAIMENQATTGTLGCFVKDKTTGKLCILSNWHVLDNDFENLEHQIIQPGAIDSGAGQQTIGTLLRSDITEAGDYAICSVESNIDWDPEILGLHVIPQQTQRAKAGDRVVKSGRSTGVTHGEVIEWEVTTKVFPAASRVIYVDGFVIKQSQNEPFPAANGEISMEGDSGAVWMLEENDQPTQTMVGLHFAGEATDSAPEFAMACNAPDVFQNLNISLDISEFLNH